MNKEELNAQRERLSSTLGEIVESTKKIGEEMKSVRHRKGMANRSLKPHSGHNEHVMHFSDGGILAWYTHTDGNLYEIHVHKR